MNLGYRTFLAQEIKRSTSFFCSKFRVLLSVKKHRQTSIFGSFSAMEKERRKKRKQKSEFK